MPQLNFDANTVDPNTVMEPIPADWYPVKIVESEMKPTSNGNGAYLELTMEVLSGEYAGRKLFDRLNLQNQNPVAQEIAYKTLSAICHAVDVIQVQDSQQLHGRPMDAKVKVKPADGQYDATNEVKGYRRSEGAMGAGGPPMGGQPNQQQTQQPMNQSGPGAGFTGNQNQQPQQQQNQQGWVQSNNPEPNGPQGFGNQQNQQPQQNQNQQQQPNQNQQQNWQGNQNQQSQNQQEQQPQQQNQQAWQNPQGQPDNQQNMATGQPNNGPAPSAGNNGDAPPWAQQNQQ